jgi:hypothetical protein
MPVTSLQNCDMKKDILMYCQLCCWFAQADLQGAFVRFTLADVTSISIRRSLAMAVVLSTSGGSGETSCDSEVTKT